MAEWRVRLDGDARVLRRLSEILRSTELSIVEDGGTFDLRSSDLDALSDEADVRATAANLVAVMNGVGRRHSPTDFEPINIGSVLSRLHGDGSRTVSIGVRVTVAVEEETHVEVRDEHGNLVEGDKTSSQAALPFESVALALRRDQRFIDASENLALADDTRWATNLYKVYEIIALDVGERALGRPFSNKEYLSNFTDRGRREMASKDRKDWIPKSTLDHFLKTVHSPTASNQASRHAFETNAPFDPIAREDAQRLIADLFERWARWKLRG